MRVGRAITKEEVMLVGGKNWIGAKTLDTSGDGRHDRAAVTRALASGSRVSAVLDVCDEGQQEGHTVLYLNLRDNSWAGVRFDERGSILSHVVGLGSRRELERALRDWT